MVARPGKRGGAGAKEEVFQGGEGIAGQPPPCHHRHCSWDRDADHRHQGHRRRRRRPAAAPAAAAAAATAAAAAAVAAGVGVALGYSASQGFNNVNESIDIKTTHRLIGAKNITDSVKEFFDEYSGRSDILLGFDKESIEKRQILFLKYLINKKQKTGMFGGNSDRVQIQVKDRRERKDYTRSR